MSDYRNRHAAILHPPSPGCYPRDSGNAVEPSCRDLSAHDVVPYSRLMLTVERVAHLRRVELFAATPDRVLAGVATVLDEVTFAAGEVLISAGAIEDWLFIVVSGAVEVVRSDRTVRLSAGAVVGELAVLDRQERTATVTAVEPTLAFRLTKPAFDDALRARPEIALGVIAELVRRIRETHVRPTPR